MLEILTSPSRTLLARVRRQTRENGGARGPRDSRRPDSPRRPAGPGRGRLHAFAVTALTVLTAFTWLLGIGLLASCGAEEKPEGTKTAPPKVSAGNSAGNGADAGNAGQAKAQDDVRVTDCQGTAPGKAGVHATVEITNSTDQPWGYSGTVLFKDPAGKKIATGLFAKNTVKPGQKVEAGNIPGDTYERYPDVTCELDGVRRNPPK